MYSTITTQSVSYSTLTGSSIVSNVVTGSVIGGNTMSVSTMNVSTITASGPIIANNPAALWMPSNGSASIYITDSSSSLTSGTTTYGRYFGVSGAIYQDFYNSFQWRGTTVGGIVNTAPMSLTSAGNLSVAGNVGIGKDPGFKLDVAGAINCTSFLVNGTAVATGTGSVWGVNGSSAYYTSGNVGIGTISPTASLHINNASGNRLNMLYLSSIQSGIVLDSTASSNGRSYNIWSTNGSDSVGSGCLAFFDMIASAYRMIINPSGNVGIGTNSVYSALHVYGQSGFNTSNGIVTLMHSTTPTTWSCGPNANGIFVILNGFGNTGVQLSSGTSSWTAFSDKRLKRDIVSIDSALSLLLQLRPVNFNYKTDIESEKPRSGFIAQEVQQVFPNDKYWIISNNIGTFNDDNGNEFNAFGLSMTEMIPYLVKAVQEQNMIIQQQSTHIASLESKIATLESKIASLESQIASLEPQVASLEPQVATLEPKVASLESQLNQLLAWAKSQGFSQHF